MNFKRKALSSFIAFSLALATVPMSIFASEENPDLTIVFNNDTHARTFGDPVSAGIKKYYESQDVPTLLLHGGDSLHGQAIASLTDGEAIVRSMSSAGYDAMVTGNHEYNYGLDRLIELSEMSSFPFLASNVVYKNTGEYVFEPYTVVEFDDMSVGIFGLATPETLFKSEASNVADIDILDPTETATKMVDELESQNVDFIVATTHLGVDDSTKEEWQSTYVAENVNGIDVMVDGHSHTYMEDGIQAGDTLVVQTGEYYENIGVLEVYDMNESNEHYELNFIDPSFDEENVVPEQYSNFIPDAEVSALVDELNAEAEEITSEVVGYTPVTLDGEREQVRTQETNLTTLLCDALIYSTGADLALGNGGNTRASIPAGDITLGDVITTWPFGNIVVTVEVTGQEFVDILEHGLSAAPEPAGHFPHIAGAVVQYDPQLEPYNRIVSITNEDGTPFDLEKTYVLATNEFTAGGGDDFPHLADKDILEYFQLQSDIVIDYINEGFEIPSAPAGRIIAVDSLNPQQPQIDPIPPVAPITPEVDPMPPVEPITPEVDPMPPVAPITPEVDPMPPVEPITPEVDPMPPVEPITPELPVEQTSYTVVYGDTLSGIALEYNTTWEHLAEVNDIENPNLIYVGQVLIIK